MKIFSPHRRKLEASRRFGSKEFQNKIKKAQGYKRIFDPRSSGFAKILHKLHLDSLLLQGVLVAGVLLFLYFLSISPYFIVSEINVTGNFQVNADQIKEAVNTETNGRWFFIPKKHLFILSKSRVENIITTNQPLVKEIHKYKRVWPNRIEVEVTERIPGFAFAVDGKNYLIDDEGYVVRELSEVKDIPLVINQLSEPMKVGERLNNTKFVAFVLSGYRQWPNKITAQVREIKIPGKAANQVQFVTFEGWGVFFDLNRPADEQISNLSLILNRQIPAQNRVKLAYIDLRFDKWAYYCYKDSPCEAEPQAVFNEEQTPIEGEKIEVE